MTALMDRPADRRMGERRLQGRWAEGYILPRRRVHDRRSPVAKLYPEVEADARIRRRLRVYVGGETA